MTLARSLGRTPLSDNAPSRLSWSNSRGSFYIISEVPYTSPQSWSLQTTRYVQMVYDAGGVSAVCHRWRLLQSQNPGPKYNTRTSYVDLPPRNSPGPLSFVIPDVHYHAKYHGPCYHFLSRLTDETYSFWVVEVCKEMAIWQADSISGIDGKIYDGRSTYGWQISI